MLPQSVRRLTDAEKQLIQALLHSEEMVRPVLEPLVEQEFWLEVWSWPVLGKLIKGAGSMESALEGVDDVALASEIRGAALESGQSLTLEHVFASVQKLFDAHLSRQEKSIGEELKKCGNGAAPVELLKRLQEIQFERNRVANTLKTRV